MMIIKFVQKILLWVGVSFIVFIFVVVLFFVQDDSVFFLEIIIVMMNCCEESIQDVVNFVMVQFGEDFVVLIEGGVDIFMFVVCILFVYVESFNGCVVLCFYICGLGNIDFDLVVFQLVFIIMDDIVQENVIFKSFLFFDIQQVEIVCGLQGMFFGCNMIVGMIMFDSVCLFEEIDGYMSLMVGSLDIFNLEGVVGGMIIDDVLMGCILVMMQNCGDWINNVFFGIFNVMGGYCENVGCVQLFYMLNESFDVLFNVYVCFLVGMAVIFCVNILMLGDNGLNENFVCDEVYYDSVFNNLQNYDFWGVSVNMNFYFDGGMIFIFIIGYEIVEGCSFGDIDGGNMVIGLGFILFLFEMQDGLDDLDQFIQEFCLVFFDDLDMIWQIGVYYFDGVFDIIMLGLNGGFLLLIIVCYENELWVVFGQVLYQVIECL